MPTSKRAHGEVIQSAALITVTAAAVVSAALMLWAGQTTVLLVFAGVLVAIVINFVSSWFAGKTHLSTGWSLAAVLCTALIAAGAVAIFLVPHISDQIEELGNELPQAFKQLAHSAEKYRWTARLVSEVPNAEAIVSQVRGHAGQLASLFAGTLGVAGNLLVVLFIGIALAAQPDLYRRGIIRLIPMSRRKRSAQVLTTLHTSLQHWLIAKIGLMIFVGVYTGIGLFMLGIPLAFTLACLAAAFDFIPNIGPVVSAVPAVLLGFVQSPMTAVWVIIVYFAAQAIESYVLAPVIQQKAVSLAPALLITAQILFGTVLGFLGLVLPTPLTVVLMDLIRMLYVEDAIEGGGSP